MENLQRNIRKHKKIFGVLGLVFIVCLECCIFPVGNLSLGGGVTVGLINLATAIGISKCIGEIETHIFQIRIFLIFTCGECVLIIRDLGLIRLDL